jgi:hypothetical protein
LEKLFVIIYDRDTLSRRVKMKYLLTALILSIGSVSASEYSPNDGETLPDTFTQKSNVPEKQEARAASPVSTESGILNSSGIAPDEMNTSPNPAPSTDREAIDSTTLRRDQSFDKKPEEIQAQEEDALDYSTTPEKRPVDKKKK